MSVLHSTGMLLAVRDFVFPMTEIGH